MRGDKRCASFRKEKPTGLSRTLSWLSVSSISRQSRRIFHSQNELHAAHNRQTHSHPHLYGTDRDEEDEDNWVYQPQHKTGEDEIGKENQIRSIDDSIQMFYIFPVEKHTQQTTQHVYLGWITASSQTLTEWIFVRNTANDCLHAHAKQEVGHCLFMALHPLP